MIKIINCHSHIFTLNHVPNNFVPVPLKILARYSLIRPLARLLQNLNPFSDQDMFDRYANFVQQGNQATQQSILNELIRFYPSDTKFVILSMDMDSMGAGNAKFGFLKQLEELAILKQQYGDTIIPFICADPRRKEGLLPLVQQYIEEKGFGGIKLYPPLGYYPFDKWLNPVYEYAISKNLPIMTHCSKGGIFYKGNIPNDWLKHPETDNILKKTTNRKFAQNFSHPDNYLYVLKKYPKLKLCFAHFGGASEWKLYHNSPSNYKDSWFFKIKELLKDKNYPNLFTDIAYTISEVDKSPNLIDPQLLDILNLCLLDPILSKKILFGSDFYMVNIEGSEFKFSIRLRRELGETQFKQIAEINPNNYI